jgi:hypothetical protein
MNVQVCDGAKDATGSKRSLIELLELVTKQFSPTIQSAPAGQG